jgi:hypothetical protein
MLVEEQEGWIKALAIETEADLWREIGSGAIEAIEMILLVGASTSMASLLNCL